MVEFLDMEHTDTEVQLCFCHPAHRCYIFQSELQVKPTPPPLFSKTVVIGLVLRPLERSCFTLPYSDLRYLELGSEFCTWNVCTDLWVMFWTSPFLNYKWDFSLQHRVYTVLSTARPPRSLLASVPSTPQAPSTWVSTEVPGDALHSPEWGELGHTRGNGSQGLDASW
jgi:hypothetical protein